MARARNHRRYRGPSFVKRDLEKKNDRGTLSGADPSKASRRSLDYLQSLREQSGARPLPKQVLETLTKDAVAFKIKVLLGDVRPERHMATGKQIDFIKSLRKQLGLQPYPTAAFKTMLNHEASRMIDDLKERQSQAA